MPLTFAHPAAVIPFRYLPRRYYSWTGLIAGSLTPDFEAFLRLGGSKQFSHSWEGMFLLDLPLCLCLSFLFHCVVRNYLINNLPPFLSARFAVYLHFNWIAAFKQRYAVIILSMLVGIFSHLLWDRITHLDTYAYHRHAGIVLAPETAIAIRQWLQWTNSIAGGLLICYQIFLLPRVRFHAKTWIGYWLVVIMTTVIFVLFRLQQPFFVDDVVNAGIAGALLGLILASLSQRYFDSQTNLFN